MSGRGTGGGRSRGIGLLSWLVRADRRDAWRREWQAELEHARAAGESRVRVRLAALEDALRLWPEGVRAGTLFTELRYAVRTLGRHPAFTVSAVITLGLGIGANTAVFSVVEASLLRPLPVREPDRVAVVLKDGQSSAGATSAPDFVDWRERNRSFEDLAAVHLWSANLTGGNLPVRVTRSRVSPSFFRILGLKPSLGRDFVDDEGIPGHDRVVVLSHELWMSSFGGDTGIIGRTVRIDDVEYTVVGVAPAGFRAPPFSTQIWVPLALDADMLSARGRNNLYVIGRLRAGESLEAARSSMRAIGDRLARDYPEANEDRSVTVQTLGDFALGTAPGALWRLLGAVGLVLLIACVNVANLVIARGVSLERELAVRVSLGASRGRLVGHLLAESAVLGVIGGVLGLLLAQAALGPIRRLVPASLSAAGDVSLDARVLVVTMSAAILTGLAAGLLPALKLSVTGGSLSKDASAALRVRGGASRVRASLAVAQYALATVLLVASALVVRSLVRLYAVDTGVRHVGVTAFGVTFPEASFATSERVVLAIDAVTERIVASPGVESAAAVSHLPLTGSRLTSSVVIEGGPQGQSVRGPSASIRVVTPGYFELMGVRLLEGRTFDEGDRTGSEPVVVINRTAAATFWPGEDAIGRWIAYTDGPDGKPLRRRVVGVIGDILFAGPASPPVEEVYEVHRQTMEVWKWFGRSMTFVVRTSSNAAYDIRDARAAVAAVDASLPIIGHGLLSERLDRALAAPRFNGALLGVFGALAVGLAGIGMYGVLAFSVRRRSRELGIRLALGAERRILVGGVLADGFRIAALGMAIGLAGALAVGRLLRSLVWGIEPSDPLTISAVLAVLAGATLLASWVPAQRAASIDPVRSLQSE